MFGMVASMGCPFSPWHELQIWSFASRLSAAFAGAAGAANAAEMTSAPRRVGTLFLIMFTLPLFECPRSRDARGALEPGQNMPQTGRRRKLVGPLLLRPDDCTAANAGADQNAKLGRILADIRVPAGL